MCNMVLLMDSFHKLKPEIVETFGLAVLDQPDMQQLIIAMEEVMPTCVKYMCHIAHSDSAGQLAARCSLLRVLYQVGSDSTAKHLLREIMMFWSPATEDHPGGLEFSHPDAYRHLMSENPNASPSVFVEICNGSIGVVDPPKGQKGWQPISDRYKVMDRAVVAAQSLDTILPPAQSTRGEISRRAAAAAATR